ncbi:caskin-2-like isoform X2 [Macrobrachium rosenbergii]|uniref:caskin-2-like isoform X2 n=1 Tax=Macrobrachium rosenbergii TaxID=79674 RepID=UPI0034D5AAD1
MYRSRYPAPLTKTASCRDIPLSQKGPSDENQDQYTDGGECLTNIPEEGEEKTAVVAAAAGEEEARRERTQEVKAAGRQGTPLYLWGTGWKSEADLPSSVADCFEDPSLLARLQARLLTLLGRASRYRLQRGLGAPPVMSLDTLRRKVKEARKRLLHHHPTVATSASQHSTSSSSSTSSSPLTRKGTSDSLATPDSPASRLSSPGVIHDALSRRNDSGITPPGSNSLQQYWGGERETSGGEEELELLQQYLNLQQLAVSRKHSTQLRRIRDSLVSRVRSRPSSMVKPSVTPRENPKAPVPNKERQALRNFLLDIGFVQYYSLLNRHGYDLATAAHMDALDLASVGITEPLHRMAIKFEFDLVKRPPPVPDDIPETCEEWLSSMGLEDYIENFHQNGIYCPLAALGLTKRDLQVMGIYMLGHRKKILLAILGLKESLLRRE